MLSFRNFYLLSELLSVCELDRMVNWNHLLLKNTIFEHSKSYLRPFFLFYKTLNCAFCSSTATDQQWCYKEVQQNVLSSNLSYPALSFVCFMLKVQHGNVSLAVYCWEKGVRRYGVPLYLFTNKEILNNKLNIIIT
jgi:hypothetical protein